MYKARLGTWWHIFGMTNRISCKVCLFSSTQISINFRNLNLTKWEDNGTWMTWIPWKLVIPSRFISWKTHFLILVGSAFYQIWSGRSNLELANPISIYYIAPLRLVKSKFKSVIDWNKWSRLIFFSFGRYIILWSNMRMFLPILIINVTKSLPNMRD